MLCDTATTSNAGGPICLIIEYAMHGNLKSFLRSCEEAAMTLNHKPLFLRKRSHSSSYSSVSSSQQLLSGNTPSSNQTFLFPRDVQVRYIAHPPPLVGQDSLMGLDCIPEGQRVAYAGGAHPAPPLSHDYLNCKGLMYMEDVQTFALQIASGLQHLETMEVRLITSKCTCSLEFNISRLFIVILQQEISSFLMVLYSKYQILAWRVT